MHVITAANVNGAYSTALENIRSLGENQDSRAGPVLVADMPVTTVYWRPYQRVLFGEQRDANPFFHLFESLWMMQGRRDATWLDQFVSDFSSRFAEEDGNSHGAYGWRWFNHFDMDGGGEESMPDQISLAVRLLRKNPNDRRVVIQMWDSVADLGADKRDVPCNTQIMPRVRDGELDFTVTCRSNDIIWGAYGANAVHFSFLQEVMAAMIGVRVGRLFQISNNWHGYLDVLNKYDEPSPDLYKDANMRSLPVVDKPESWFPDLHRFMEDPFDCVCLNNFFEKTAKPMMWAHAAHKKGESGDAMIWAEKIEAPDWRHACRGWLRRRTK